MDVRPCQSEPLNLAVALKETARPPSRALRLTINTDLQPQAKGRLPAKMRLKAQLVSPNSAQVSVFYKTISTTKSVYLSPFLSYGTRIEYFKSWRIDKSWWQF